MEEEVVQKKRGRPKKVVTEDVQIKETIQQENDKLENPIAVESNVNISENVVEQDIKESITEDVAEPNTELVEEKNTVEDILSQGYQWTSKFKPGDSVWVPEYVNMGSSSLFGVINNRYGRIPKNYTISEISISNHIRYRFYGTRSIVCEEYVFIDKKDCQVMCDKLNG